MTAYHKNLSTGLTQKSFSAGPLGLRAWIWPGERFDTIEVGMVISLRLTLSDFVHRFIHNYNVFTCHCWSTTTRNGRVYKNTTKYENVTKAQPLMSQLPIV